MESAGNRQVLSDAPRLMALSEELQRLPPPEAVARLRGESDDIAARALALINPAAAVDILGRMPDARREQVAAAAPDGRGAQWSIILRYPEESVGRLMERALAVYHPETKVGDAIDEPARARAEGLHHLHLRDRRRRAPRRGAGVPRASLRQPRPAAGRRSCCATRSRCSPDMPLVDAMRTVVTRHSPGVSRDGRPRAASWAWCAGRPSSSAQAYEISAQAGSMVGVEKEERVATPLVAELPLPASLAPAQPADGLRGGGGRRILPEHDRPASSSSPCSFRSSRASPAIPGCQALAATLRGLTLGELRNMKAAPAGDQGGDARSPERRSRRPRRGRRDVVLRALTARRGTPCLLGFVVWMAMTIACMISGIAGALVPLTLEAPRRRSRDRVEHLPDDGDRRREHGNAAGAGDAARALTPTRDYRFRFQIS